MKKNVGSADKIGRLIIALVLFSMYFVLDGSLKYISFLGIVPLATALMNFCPLYTVFGINTDKK